MSPCAARGRAGVVIVDVGLALVEVLGHSKGRKHREGVADVVRVDHEVLNPRHMGHHISRRWYAPAGQEMRSSGNIMVTSNCRLDYNGYDNLRLHMRTPAR